MTGDQSLTAEQALQLHKNFLQDILLGVVKILGSGEAGADRMIKGLNAYWNVSYRYGPTRRKVQVALAGTAHENAQELMGRPFRMMLSAELQASKVQNIDALSQEIYNEAHDIALTEALSGKRVLGRRKKLAARIRAISQPAEQA